MNQAGYGRFYRDGKRLLAHRQTYIDAHGPIGDDTIVDHLCHNADPTCPGGPTCKHHACIEITHLNLIEPTKELTANQINLLRHYESREQRTLCANGHDLAANGVKGRKGRKGTVCLECERQRTARYREARRDEAEDRSRHLRTE